MYLKVARLRGWEKIKGRKGNIKIQQNLGQSMATLKIIYAAASNPSPNEECPYCIKWMDE